jgi:hypothetical protein
VTVPKSKYQDNMVSGAVSNGLEEDKDVRHGPILRDSYIVQGPHPPVWKPSMAFCFDSHSFLFVDAWGGSEQTLGGG